MDNEKNSHKRQIIIRLVVLVVLLIVFIVGIILCCTGTTHSMTHEEQYIDTCMDFQLDKPCNEFKPFKTYTDCQCFFNFVLKHDLKGAVTLYYELESFYQTNSTYANSRDDSQLKGNPGLTPAPSCGEYSYDDNKTIFPCGEVADSMFNDTFTDFKFEKSPVSVVYTKLFAEDTPAFRNPPEDVLNNFTWPKNWGRDRNGQVMKPWETDTELKGVENPAFQAWMDTSLKRKPVWRVEPKGEFVNGLPAGNYSLLIKIAYGVDRYNGVRKLILEGKYFDKDWRKDLGIAFIVVSLFGLLGGAAYMYKIENDIVMSIYDRYFGSDTAITTTVTRRSWNSDKTPTESEASTQPRTPTDKLRPANDDTNLPLLNRLRNSLRRSVHAT